MNEPKLLPCPFCGGEAGEFSLGVTKHSYIKCRVCGAGAPTKPTAAEAVSAWNRRAPLPDNKALTVEELREMDGEPVWVVYDDDSAMWALVDAGHIGKKLKLTGNWGEQIVLDEHKHHVKAIYRRPPEKGEL